MFELITKPLNSHLVLSPAGKQDLAAQEQFKKTFAA